MASPAAGPTVASSVGVVVVVREAARALGPRRIALYVLGVVAFAQSAVETAVLYLVAQLVLALTKDERAVDVAVGPFPETALSHGDVLLIASVLLVVVLALSVPVARYSARLSTDALTRVRNELVDRWFAASSEHRASQREGHLHTVLVDYTMRAERLVHQASLVVVSATSLVAMAVGTLVVAPGVALLAGCALFVLAVAFRPFSANTRRLSRHFAHQTQSFAASTAQAVRMTQEIAAFDVNRPVAAMMREQIRDAGDALARVRFHGILTPTLYQYGALAVVLVITGLLLAFESGNELAAAAPVLLLMIRALTYAKQLQNAVQVGNEMAPFLETIADEVRALEANPAPGGDRPLAGRGRVVLEDVGFAYPQHEPVLAHVTLTIEPGAAVGIIGPSGGGKTTLVQLLLRLRVPTTGRITVDGEDLLEADHASLAAAVAFVPQDNKLIYGSIADNIRFYRAGFDDADVAAAAEAAHLHDEITALPGGYSTIVGPGARDISGGQRQRLGIARALLGRPALLVLDEPTSALDARSEHLIRDTLMEMRGRTTIVAVAHRPATLDICDRVLLVEHGVVSEVEHTAPRSPTG